MIRVMDLFSGIGGFSLGLRKAGGFRTVAYCEIDPFCQRVLQARMREGKLDTAPICSNIRHLDGEPWEGRVDLICGGFPCQDISLPGPGDGIDGERSGLWGDMARLVREIRPQYVLVENVSALLGRGLGRVLGDLAESGYDAEWDCLRASSFGAEHARERIFIVAHSMRQGLPVGSEAGTDKAHQRVFESRGGSPYGTPVPGLERCGASRWSRDLHGIPDRMDRIKALGNSVVPQIVEWIGRRIQDRPRE